MDRIEEEAEYGGDELEGVIYATRGGGGVWLTVETGGAEREAADNLWEVLKMEMEGILDEVEGGGGEALL